jgi:hypothetical protein
MWNLKRTLGFLFLFELLLFSGIVHAGLNCDHSSNVFQIFSETNKFQLTFNKAVPNFIIGTVGDTSGVGVEVDFLNFEDDSGTQFLQSVKRMNFDVSCLTEYDPSSNGTVKTSQAIIFSTVTEGGAKVSWAYILRYKLASNPTNPITNFYAADDTYGGTRDLPLNGDGFELVLNVANWNIIGQR